MQSATGLFWFLTSCFRLIGRALDHRSLAPEFKSRGGHIWRAFHLWLHFITFGGRLAQLVYHVHKSGNKNTNHHRQLKPYSSHNVFYTLFYSSARRWYVRLISVLSHCTSSLYTGPMTMRCECIPCQIWSYALTNTTHIARRRWTVPLPIR